MNNPQLWFKSDKFEILEGEDSETNPLCYGRQLAEWLRTSLSASGYKVEEVIPEDWGWCVMCSREPFMLWVGCVNVHDYATTKPTDPIPKGKDVVWTCTVVAEQSFFGRLFKRIDTTHAVQELFKHVQSALANQAKVTFVELP